MNIFITLTMLGIYIAGLAYAVYSNPLPEQSFEDFAVGGRSFGWQFITMTIIGTWYPGSLLIGWAQMGYDMGVTSTYLIFYTLGGLYIFFLICSPLWKLGKVYDLKTMGQLFELRYNSRSLRIFVGLVVLLVELPWIITELLASGYAIQAITYEKIPFNLGMTIIAVFFLLYVLFSGMRAVIIADYYQGWMFLIGGMVLFGVAVYHFFGGIGPMLMEVRDIQAELLTVPGPMSGWGGEAPGALFWPSLILMGMFGAYMWPSLFSRIFAAASTKELKESIRITPFVAPIFTLLILLVAIGASARPEFNTGDSAYALVNMISSMGPVAVATISILILAGALSMMDSMISSWSIVFVNDVLTPFFPNMSPKTQTTIARVFTVLVGFAGLMMAMTDLPTIVQLLTRVYQAIVQVFPAVFLGLIWKKGNKLSAWGGTLTGIIIVAYFAFTQPDYVPFLNGMQGGLIALAINFLVYVALAYVGKPENNVDELFIAIKTKDIDLKRLT